jgi:hypothetical protein
MYDPVNLSGFLQNQPAGSDESTLQLSELLRRLSRHFDDRCHEQILRAHRARRRQRRQSWAEKPRPYEPQRKLAEEFYSRRFSPRGPRL